MTALTVSPATEVRRLRTELADAHQELARLRELFAAPDLHDDPAYWRDLFADAHAADLEAAWRAGYETAHLEMASAWHQAADPIGRGGPSFAELELRRWGPGGREHFDDPRPADYMGGPVEWHGRNAGAQ